MSFKDIFGQDKAVSILKKTIHRSRIPSSYLFAGESGIGKKFTAINLAKALNCLNTEHKAQSMELLHNSNNPPLPPFKKGGLGETDSCDVCTSCSKIDSGVHPDFLLVSPEGSQIKIEEIRKVDDILSLKAFEGKYKVVIVDDAETMNQYAANAFLKTLEEPPDDSLIILISSKPDLLPDTIRSRCSRVNFSPLSEEACEKVIQKSLEQEQIEQPPADDAQLFALIRLCMGRPGSAIAGDLVEERDWCINTLKGMLEAESDGWASREEMIRWFDIMLILLRDMAVMKVTENEAYLLNSDQKEQMRKISRATDLKGIIETYQKLNAIRNYLFFNLNKSLTWNYTGSLLRKMMG